MICPKCGTDNDNGFKFCVKCGSSLSDPRAESYDQIDMGGYHTEEEFNADSNKGFTIGSGTFTISDRPPANDTGSVFSADELNESDEEFDFSDLEEPFIPTLDAERIAVPRPAQEQQPQQRPVYPQQQNNAPQPYSGMPQQPVNNYGGQMYQQPVMYGQPQVIGYDKSGMPIYGQPAVYGQPQVIGYDQNGTPVYGQPAVYGQPQIIGYDKNGMPVYGQPAVFSQPQVIGYDQSGMPIYGQIPVVSEPPAPQHQQGMQSIPPIRPQQPEPLQEAEKPEEKRVDMPDEFWSFFDGGKSTNRRSPDDDFFGKSEHVTGKSEFPPLDTSAIPRTERKKVYMSDTPIVNAEDLAPNQATKYNELAMRKTRMVDASDMEYNPRKQVKDSMQVTKEVDAAKLNPKLEHRSYIHMNNTQQVRAEDLEAYKPKPVKKKNYMAVADHAVEAMPKKKEKYVDELDKIELPEHMKAKKTKRNEKVEIPSLPEVGIE